MTEQTEPASVRRSDVRQARAWHSVARSGEHEQWERALLVADLTLDDPGYDRLEHGIVTTWREHRDTPLPPYAQHTAELAQSIAWLRDDVELAWRRAHALALTPDERQDDTSRLVEIWRQHRDAPTLPDGLVENIGSVLRERQDRLADAEAWYRDSDPHGYTNWKTCRGFADTIEGEWSDDRRLLRQWSTATGGVRTPVRSRPDASHRDAQRPESKRTARETRRAHPGWFGRSRRPSRPGPERGL